MTDHEYACSGPQKMAWNELAIRAVLNAVLDVCLTHQVWPAELLNWDQHRGKKFTAARRDLVKSLTRDLRYTPASNNRPAMLRSTLQQTSAGERKLSYPILATLCGAGCHQGLMRMMKRSPSVLQRAKQRRQAMTDNLEHEPATEYSPPLDKGIERYVHVLVAAGVETFESCEGGPGHSYAEPTVRFHGGAGAAFRALATAIDHGLPVASLRQAWDMIDGAPTGPHWELVFWRKDERAKSGVRQLKDDPQWHEEVALYEAERKGESASPPGLG